MKDDVKSTLECMRNASVRTWMLTGDKIETATNIAVSAKLVARGQSIHLVQKLTSSMQAEDELDRLDTHSLDTCLIVDGQSLQVFGIYRDFSS